MNEWINEWLVCSWNLQCQRRPHRGLLYRTFAMISPPKKKKELLDGTFVHLCINMCPLLLLLYLFISYPSFHLRSHNLFCLWVPVNDGSSLELSLQCGHAIIYCWLSQKGKAATTAPHRLVSFILSSFFPYRLIHLVNLFHELENL